MLGMSLRSHGEGRPWSWNQVRARTLAIYQSGRDSRLRMAVLVWQADDPRVTVANASPRLLAFTMDVEPEPGAENSVDLAGFDSLEAARAHCVEWVGASDEVTWESLGETAQIGVYASIREPGFAGGD
jgi:hypothetical protein